MVYRVDIDENTHAVADVAERWNLREVKLLKENDDSYKELAIEKTRSIGLSYLDEEGNKVEISGAENVFAALEEIDYRLYGFLASYLFNAIGELFLSGSRNTVKS